MQKDKNLLSAAFDLAFKSILEHISSVLGSKLLLMQPDILCG